MSSNLNQKGLIFNIQHFSVHDGPGIRTTVFLKGCPLRCKWCANPESQCFDKELAWTSGQCIGCNSCTQELKCAKCSLDSSGLDWEVVSELSADEVKKACPSGALHVIGEEKSIDDVIDAVEKDMAFYRESGGGLTLSGGEPLSQPEFTLALLDEAHRRKISCAIETSSLAKWKTVERIAHKVDYYLTDIKCIDDKLHIENTGVSNQIILYNISRLIKEFPQLTVHIRTPVIPDFNDNDKEIEAIAEFLNSSTYSANLKWELLKYHRLGLPKYESLKRTYELGSRQISQDKFDALRDTAKRLFKNTL